MPYKTHGFADHRPENIQEITSNLLAEAITKTKEFRSHALTFRTSVGASVITFDGNIFSGFNIEQYIGSAYHAEETAFLRGLLDGYIGTDYKLVVVLFVDASHKSRDEFEIFPGCPHCWSFMYEFTHPYLEIVIANPKGEVLYTTHLKDILNPPPPGKIYPSNKIRLVKPKFNFQPKLPLNGELLPFYDADPEFKQYCDEVLKVSKINSR